MAEITGSGELKGAVHDVIFAEIRVSIRYATASPNKNYTSLYLNGMLYMGSGFDPVVIDAYCDVLWQEVQRKLIAAGLERAIKKMAPSMKKGRGIHLLAGTVCIGGVIIDNEGVIYCRHPERTVIHEVGSTKAIDAYISLTSGDILDNPHLKIPTEDPKGIEKAAAFLIRQALLL